MKTHQTPRLILSLLSVSLLTLSAVSAQTPPDLVSAGKHAVSKQQRKALTGNLSLPEKLRLRIAMKKVHDDSQMVAARQAVKDAQTKEAKHEAKSALRTLRHDLLLKADPELAGPSYKALMEHIDDAPIGKANNLSK